MGGIICSNLIVSNDKEEVELEQRATLSSVLNLESKIPENFVKVIKQEETVIQNESDSHVKIKDGELERLIPKKSSYMMDLTLGSE